MWLNTVLEDYARILGFTALFYGKKKQKPKFLFCRACKQDYFALLASAALAALPFFAWFFFASAFLRCLAIMAEYFLY